jgi:tetratricopeptide (TPR) repeat protein
LVVLSVLGKVLAERGQHDRSGECFDRAYAIADAESDDVGRVRILEQHSVAAFRRRDYEAVRELTERGVTLSRRLGERTLEATFLNNLGTAHFEIGVEAARGFHEQAMAIAQVMNDEHVLALTHRCIGADYHAQERFDDARRHLAEALRLYGRLGQTQREDKVRQLMHQFGYLT